jgi:hypothetical protein
MSDRVCHSGQVILNLAVLLAIACRALQEQLTNILACDTFGAV